MPKKKRSNKVLTDIAYVKWLEIVSNARRRYKIKAPLQYFEELVAVMYIYEDSDLSALHRLKIKGDVKPCRKIVGQVCRTLVTKYPMYLQ